MILHFCFLYAKIRYTAIQGDVPMKNKTIYQSPEIELMLLSCEDVLTASNPNTDLGPDIGEWDSEM